MKRLLISTAIRWKQLLGFVAPLELAPYISVGGTAPVDSGGKTVGVGDPAVQARRCLEIIKEALQNAGSGMHDVVRTRVLLTNIDD